MLSSQKAAYWSSHCTLDQQTGEHNLDKIFFTFVELPKFKALYKKEEQKLEELSLEERWYYFLIHAAQTTDEELRILSNSPEKVYAPGAGAKGGNQAMGVTKRGSIQNYIWPWMRMVCRSEQLLRKVGWQTVARLGNWLLVLGSSVGRSWLCYQ